MEDWVRIIYRVGGQWPFPLDMLAHDQSIAATPEDQALIDRMSGECSDPEIGLRASVSIGLTMESGDKTYGRSLGRWQPNDARWRSFGWQVLDVLPASPDLEDEMHTHEGYEPVIDDSGAPTGYFREKETGEVVTLYDDEDNADLEVAVEIAARQRAAIAAARGKE